MSTYLLGDDERERNRLRFQDEVWEAETEAFLDRLGIGEGSRVLEVGCGIGLDLPRLARRVGESGEVIGLEQSELHAAESRRLVEERGLRAVRILTQSLTLGGLVPQGPFDAIYARWVFSFLPDLRGLLEALRPCLAEQGAIGILDYNHDGFRLFPAAPAFDRVVEAFRAWYRHAGGDLWVVGRLPGAFAAAGYRFEGAWPRQLAGPPGAPVYKWAEAFVMEHGPRLADEGLITRADWSAFLEEWDRLRADPATLLFSPQVVGVLGRRTT